MSTLNAYIKSKYKDRPTKVRFRYRSGVDIDIDYTSEILINPQFWDSKKQILKKSSKYPSEEIISLNSLISKRKELILDIIVSAENSIHIDTRFINQQIQLRLNNSHLESKEIKLGFFEVFDLFLDTHELSDERKESYQVVKRALERFEYHKQLNSINFKLTFDGINIVILNEIEKYLANEYVYIKQDKKFKAKFPNHKSNKPRGINTVIGMMKKIKALNSWALKNKFTSTDAFKEYKMSESIYGTPIFIYKPESNTLLKMPLYLIFYL